MNINKFKLLENRYERKYTLKAGESWKFQNFLLNHGFKRTFKNRLVNSIYYDNEDKKFFHENINGISERIKTRLRWYDDMFNVQLELKKKSNMISWKQTFSAGLFKSFSELQNFYKNKESISKVSNLSGFLVKPKLLVRYIREYWESSCQNFRATVDTNIEYKNIKSINLKSKGLDSDFNVLEFKYLSYKDSDFRAMINKTNFPFRMSKHSKYVSAVINLNNVYKI